MELTVKVEVKLTEEEIDDILCTALEGEMMDYWACIDNTTPEWIAAKKKVQAAGREAYMSTVFIQMMEEDQAILIEDAEIEEGDEESQYESIYGEGGTVYNPWKFTKERFIKGVQLYCENRGNIKEALDNGSFDDIEADCLIQYAVFGDIIFG